MDRQITKEEKDREKRKQLFKVGLVALAVIAIVCGIIFFIEEKVSEKSLIIKTADVGTIESSVSASGKVVPLYEVTIVSPVATKIMEIYCNEGDTVVPGESLLRLDLQSTETEYRKANDQLNMKRNEIEQASLSVTTHLTDLEMRIKTKEMAVSHLGAEVANEKRLDSIGSGTGDRIREAELAYETGKLELAQMKMQLENERKSQAAAFRSKQLEGEIYQRNFEAMKRTLDDARVSAPKAGTVTYLNKSLGTSISAGERLAVVSDLTKFKILGQIAESNSGKLAIGVPVNVRVGRDIIKGRISTVSPQSQNGLVDFTVVLENEDDPHLRSGLRTELNVVYDVKDDVVRIPTGNFFQGPGVYQLFVKTAEDRLERRDVSLGDSNFDYVEVISGIEPGENVVLNDMSDYIKKHTLGLK